MALVSITPRAFFFDFDGVIFDSEPAHLAAAREVSRSHGVDFTDAYYYEILLGFDDVGLFAKLWQDNNRPIDARIIVELRRAKNAAFLRLAAQEMRTFPGVTDFISRLANENIPLAVVSGALRSEIDACLKRADLNRYFSFIVSADDVENSKPDPESYLMAFDKMQATIPGLTKADCWVIEDSPAGIDSAQAAGIKVIGITNSCKENEIKHANALVSHYSEITIGKKIS